MPTSPIKIALVFESKTNPKLGLTGLAAALTRQANEHLGSAWGLPPVQVYPAAGIPAGHWGLVLLDDSDQANALGYHDLTPSGFPIGKVFVKPTLADGEKVGVTASHELMEMLCDPDLNLAAQADNGDFYAMEVADPVQEQEYAIDGIPVSNFVYPTWFESFRTAGSVRFDHLKTVTRPFQLMPGGYISIFRAGRWKQIFGSTAARAKFNPKRKKRALRRAGK